MPNTQISRKLLPLMTTPKPIKAAIGGRGSGKSMGVADILIRDMMVYAYDLYCIREFKENTGDSVHRVLMDSIERHDIKEQWIEQEHRLIGPDGQRTRYTGIQRNPDGIQSAQKYLRCWVEEAQTLSQESIDKLLPTILRNPEAEMFLTANPQSSGDPFSKRFINPFLDQLKANGFYEDDLHLIVVVNWRDNPWWNDLQESLRMHDFKTMSKAKYRWIWEGDFYDEVDGSIIKAEWFDAAVDLHKDERFEAMFQPKGAKIAAHDPFDGGSDAAGFAVRHGSVITNVETKREGEIDQCCDWAMDRAKALGCDWFVWDGDGMGTGLKGQIKKFFAGTKIDFHMFRGSLSGVGQDNAKALYEPDNDSLQGETSKTYADTFKNNRAQYYTAIARRFHNAYKMRVRGEYINPEDAISIDSEGVHDLDDLRSQLCRIPEKLSSTGPIQIMSKLEMKSLGITSPNEADAVMMTMFEPQDGSFEELDFNGW